MVPYLQCHSSKCLVSLGCHQSSKPNPTKQAKTLHKSFAIGHNEVVLLHFIAIRINCSQEKDASAIKISEGEKSPGIEVCFMWNTQSNICKSFVFCKLIKSVCAFSSDLSSRIFFFCLPLIRIHFYFLHHQHFLWAPLIYAVSKSVRKNYPNMLSEFA